jgi:hypothetical protein
MSCGRQAGQVANDVQILRLNQERGLDYFAGLHAGSSNLA